MRKTANLRGIIVFGITTILLVLISAFCVTGTVMSQSNISDRELENYYRVQEAELLMQTREKLESLGYDNSGVTLTKVIDEEGRREYTFTIHHRKIDRMSAEEKVLLAKELACDTPLAENCNFYHEFLMYE